MLRADPATFTVRQLTPDTALKAGEAAFAKCRADGYQVAVAVVDRAGLTQVLLRDRFAGPHTVEISANKAWSAVSFRTSTSDIEKASRPGESMAGIRQFPRLVAVGGGLMIEAGGSVLCGGRGFRPPRGAAAAGCARPGAGAGAATPGFCSLS